MADFTAQDVKRLRDQTGAGMMDAKRALVENDGDHEVAARWLREKGLAQSEKRAGRDAQEGAVALVRDGGVAAVVELRSETDFVAKSPDFIALADEIAAAVVERGEGAVDDFKERVEDLKVTLKENIDVGRVVRFEADDGEVVDTYLHVQNGRGTNAVLVELADGTQELAHDVAVHIAFARPGYLTRDEFPAEVVAEKRAELEAISRNEGKPEAALPKIVDGRLTGFYKAVPGGALLEQGYAKDEKRSIAEMLGGARILRFAQVEIGG